MREHIIPLLIFIFSYTNAQIRYKNEIFTEVMKTEDVVYGNSPELAFPFALEWFTEDTDLTMDIYQAYGDTVTKRPVIIFMHPGAFFSGSHEADDMVALSNSAAKMGYVAVSLAYRLNYNVLRSYSAERAIYRGTQDLSAAIRYLREHHLDYYIDYDNIFLWGSSAGAVASIQLSYMEEEDRLDATYGDGWMDPDLGCIDCSGNTFIHNSKPSAVIGCWGFILDLNWINEGDEIPLIMFHGSADRIVPIADGYPFTTGYTLPYVYGSSLIHSRLDSLNISSELYVEEGLPHEYWGTHNGFWLDGRPNEHFTIIKESAFSFLFNILYPFQIGDINNDGLLDQFDVSSMSSILIGDNYDHFELYYTDLNFDGNTNIFDLIMLIGASSI